jgi:hypothetical protein
MGFEGAREILVQASAPLNVFRWICAWLVGGDRHSFTRGVKPTGINQIVFNLARDFDRFQTFARMNYTDSDRTPKTFQTLAQRGVI